MDERLEDLRQQLDRKTTEIESLVAAKQGLGSVGSMEPAEYDRLQHDVEELLERWEESAQEGPADIEDSQLSKLIAERYAIEQEIVAAKGDNLRGEDNRDEEVEDEGASEDDWD